MRPGPESSLRTTGPAKSFPGFEKSGVSGVAFRKAA